LLVLFRRHGTATAAQIAEHLGLAQRTVVSLCRSWLKTGFLELKNPSRKNRSYRLGKSFEFLIE
jgi:DNA-binding IclR family transcriptional regulator